MMSINYDEVEVGLELPARSFPARRVDLVRYAGASGDFNPIHWNERYAVGVGLPNVIAHGMFTMAVAVRLVTDWVGDPAAVLEYGVRFTRPVVVPDDTTSPDDADGTSIDVTGVVAKKLDERRVRVDLTALSGGDRVLGVARALVRLD